MKRPAHRAKHTMRTKPDRSRSRTNTHSQISPTMVARSEVAVSYHPLGSRPFESLFHRAGAAAITAPVYHRSDIDHKWPVATGLGSVGNDTNSAHYSAERPLSRDRAAVALPTTVIRSESAVSYHPLGSRSFESLFHTTGAASTTAPVALMRRPKSTPIGTLNAGSTRSERISPYQAVGQGRHRRGKHI